jgi:hypothetical protein
MCHCDQPTPTDSRPLSIAAIRQPDEQTHNANTIGHAMTPAPQPITIDSTHRPPSQPPSRVSA